MDFFRNFMQSWVGKTFLGIVLVVFVVFAFLPSINLPGSRGEVAEVDGEPISSRQLDAALERERARYGDQMDRRMVEMLVTPQSVLDGLVRQKVLALQAADLGLVAPVALLREAITDNPAFKGEDGAFSAEVYQRVLVQNGFPGPQAYIDQLEQTSVMEQLGTALIASSFVTHKDLELAERIAGQTRDLAWLVLAPTAYTAGIEVSEADIKARYDANTAGYLTEEELSFDYVEVDAARYAGDVEVSEDEVRKAWDAQVAAASANAERRIAHILVTAANGRDEAAMQARAAEVQQKLAAGGDFAALAKEYSDDAGSAALGGELGFIGRGALDPALEAAVFALAANGTTAPVKTADGLHIARVLEVRGASVTPYAQARAQLLADLRQRAALERFHEARDRLADLAYEADGLQEPARELGLVVQTVPLFAPGRGTGLAADERVLAQLKSPDVLEDGRNSTLVSLGNDRALVLHLKEHRKPVRRPLAEVADAIRAELVFERASLVAAQKVETMRAALEAGQAIDSVAAGMPVMRVPVVSRPVQGVPEEIAAEAFRLAAPAAGKPSVAVVKMKNGSSALVVVEKVVDGNLLGRGQDEIAGMRRQFGQLVGRDTLGDYMAWATAQRDVMRFPLDAKGRPVSAGELESEAGPEPQP